MSLINQIELALKIQDKKNDFIFNKDKDEYIKFLENTNGDLIKKCTELEIQLDKCISKTDKIN